MTNSVWVPSSALRYTVSTSLSVTVRIGSLCDLEYVNSRAYNATRERSNKWWSGRFLRLKSSGKDAPEVLFFSTLEASASRDQAEWYGEDKRLNLTRLTKHDCG